MTLRTFLVVLALLGASFGGGCSKNSAPVPATAQSLDLGPVELTYGVPSPHDLGDGKSCVITAQPLDQTTFELTAVVEKGGKKLASTRVVPARIGAPLNLALGYVTVQLIPQIKPN